MILQFVTTIRMATDGEIKSSQIVKTRDLTQDASEMFTDLNRLHATFATGVKKVLTSDVDDVIEDDDDLDEDDDDDLEDDDFEEDDDDDDDDEEETESEDFGEA
jgi:hypothetical protein